MQQPSSSVAAARTPQSRWRSRSIASGQTMPQRFSATAPKVCPALGVVRVLRTLDCVMGKTDPTPSTSLTAPQGPVSQRSSRWTALPPQRCVQRSEWSECYARSIASRAGKPLPLFYFRRASLRRDLAQVSRGRVSAAVTRSVEQRSPFVRERAGAVLRSAAVTARLTRAAFIT